MKQVTITNTITTTIREDGKKAWENIITPGLLLTNSVGKVFYVDINNPGRLPIRWDLYMVLQRGGLKSLYLNFSTQGLIQLINDLNLYPKYDS